MPFDYDPVAALHGDQLQFDRSFRFLPGDTKAVERQYKPHILALLRAAGFTDLEIGCCGANDPYDLLVCGNQVEIKVSRNIAKRPHYYKALLHDRHNNHHLNGHFILFVCITKNGDLCPFVIPIWAVGTRCTLEITSDPFSYRGRWAHYRGRLDLLKGGGQ